MKKTLRILAFMERWHIAAILVLACSAAIFILGIVPRTCTVLFILGIAAFICCILVEMAVLRLAIRLLDK